MTAGGDIRKRMKRLQVHEYAYEYILARSRALAAGLGEL